MRDGLDGILKRLDQGAGAGAADAADCGGRGFADIGTDVTTTGRARDDVGCLLWYIVVVLCNDASAADVDFGVYGCQRSRGGGARRVFERGEDGFELLAFPTAVLLGFLGKGGGDGGDGWRGGGRVDQQIIVSGVENGVVDLAFSRFPFLVVAVSVHCVGGWVVWD